MPAIVGMVNVNLVTSSAVFNIGDVFRISPFSTSKTFSGAGSFNTGETLYVYNHQSNTNTYDKDFIDQPNSFNV
ncbi:spore germination protein [Pallidibacillus pasinlerensis]|uniref:Spore germination protein n=1 Tax=Pallidibacillus pasinlerensis TaxID=2703818 RepID=A0ABW9ZZH7_9BACI|nr:spore germination protein [Pallidibacillus pasinlerensis]NCU16573.1 spore germination protein [Pallidibacillus pasinlerensis]